MNASHDPIACELSLTDGAQQTLAWRTLHAEAVARERIHGGVLLTFGPSLRERVADLAAREAACCPFLLITVEDIDGSIGLRITSSQADAQPVIEMLTGIDR